MFHIFCPRQENVLASSERFPLKKEKTKLFLENSKLLISDTFHFEYPGIHVILLPRHVTGFLETIILNS